jgi:hypothetical protein
MGCRVLGFSREKVRAAAAPNPALGEHCEVLHSAAHIKVITHQVGGNDGGGDASVHAEPFHQRNSREPS